MLLVNKKLENEMPRLISIFFLWTLQQIIRQIIEYYLLKPDSSKISVVREQFDKMFEFAYGGLANKCYEFFREHDDPDEQKRPKSVLHEFILVQDRPKEFCVKHVDETELK